ncbi:hypothetical protein JXA63_01155 [Candidatus Woesebacteria bacterium]|nr:hypothetical protein [Candidatus Woesebacteria bacterium]
MNKIEHRPVFPKSQLDFRRNEARNSGILYENLDPELEWQVRNGPLELALGYQNGKDVPHSAACRCKECGGWVGLKPREERQYRSLSERTDDDQIWEDLGKTYYCDLCKYPLGTTKEEIDLPQEGWFTTNRDDRIGLFKDRK